jgi:hypothetical protein
VRAVRFHRFGGPEVLRLEEIPPPSPGPGEVLLRVGACTVNHLDPDIRAGVSRRQVRLPHILGRDYAGTVVAVGADVADFAPGTAPWLPWDGPAAVIRLGGTIRPRARRRPRRVRQDRTRAVMGEKEAPAAPPFPGRFGYVLPAAPSAAGA